MNETPKRAGLLTWMLLTGAVAAPAAAQDGRELAAEPTSQPTLVDEERSATAEESEGSGEPVIQARRREQQAKQATPDREREERAKAIQR